MAFDVNKVILPATILYRHSSAEVDGIQSTEEESAVCKEHLFVISDDLAQDHDSVLYIQRLVSKLSEVSSCATKKIHEFTGGCAGQYVKIVYFIFFSSRTLFLFLSFIYFFAKHYGIAQV